MEGLKVSLGVNRLKQNVAKLLVCKLSSPTHRWLPLILVYSPFTLDLKLLVRLRSLPNYTNNNHQSRDNHVN